MSSSGWDKGALTPLHPGASLYLDAPPLRLQRFRQLLLQVCIPPGVRVDTLLALGVEADSGGAALLGAVAFLGGAVGGAEDAPAFCSATCWTWTALASVAEWVVA